MIRQLFEPRLARRSVGGNQLSGAAALAAPVFNVSSERVGADRLAIQHGLYWPTDDVAAERPLALLVEDAHRADAASLQALLYIARRLDEVPVTVVAEPARRITTVTEAASTPECRCSTIASVSLGRDSAPQGTTSEARDDHARTPAPPWRS